MTKTNKYWHIYCLIPIWKNELKKVDIVKILSFPHEKEITAFTTDGTKLFLAFKNEGLKSYTITNESGRSANFIIKEDTEFYRKAKRVKALNFSYITLGNAITIYRTIYAVTGDDKIYRFAPDGTPDFIIRSNKEQ